MYSNEGVKFCALCGGYGVKRTTLLAAPCEKKAGNGPRVASIRELFAKERPDSLKNWPAIFQRAESESNAGGAGLISSEHGLIIRNILNEIR